MTNTPFVGLRNFERLADDGDFLESVPRTLDLRAGTTLLTVPLALARRCCSTGVPRARRCWASPCSCRGRSRPS